MTVSRPKAVSTTQINNERVVVTEWRFAPGAETGWHQHGYDYMVVPGLEGNLLIETEESGSIIESISELGAGQSYYRPAGVRHNVVNANDFEFSFVEIELK